MELTGEDDLADEIEQADDYKSGVNVAMVRIDKAIAATPITPPARMATPEPVPVRALEHRVKLPKLTLKPFNGDITHWTTFWDSFKSAIHENSALSEIDKFNYLKSLLERSSREAIAGLTLTAANYREAVSILHKRFGNKQQIISRHMELLLSLEPVTSQHQLRNLCRLYDSVETHVRSLKSLDVTFESYGSLLTSVLLSKLPQELRLIVTRKITEDELNLDALLKEVEQEIEARERAQSTQATPNQQPKKPYRESQHTAATLLTGNSSASCCYCQQTHSADNCTVVSQVEDRKQILRKSGRCFVCLRRGHISRECRSRSMCSNCNGRHHTSVCSNASSTRSRDSTTLPVASPVAGTKSRPPTTLNPDIPIYEVLTSNSSSTLYVGADKTTLLQTARAVLYNPNRPDSIVRVRAILDTGSQRSYVTDGVKQALSLETEEVQQLSIATFGAAGHKSQRFEVLRVGLKMKDGKNQELKLIKVPSICEPLTAQPISLCLNKHDHLNRLDLADYSDAQETLQIDVLIGADYYWELVTGKTSRGKDKAVAVHTRLGWVLSGPAPKTKQSKNSVNLLTTHTLHVGTTGIDADTLNRTLQSFWELESLGVKQPDQCVFTEFEEKIQFKSGRYEVSLPWRDVHQPLPDNYQLPTRVTTQTPTTAYTLEGIRHNHSRPT